MCVCVSVCMQACTCQCTSFRNPSPPHGRPLLPLILLRLSQTPRPPPPPPPLLPHSFSKHTHTHIHSMLSYAETIKLLAHRHLLSSTTARKGMHIGCGLIYLLCWPLFSASFSSSCYAMVAPLSLTVFFSLVGLGLVKNDATGMCTYM